MRFPVGLLKNILRFPFETYREMYCKVVPPPSPQNLAEL